MSEVQASKTPPQNQPKQQIILSTPRQISNKQNHPSQKTEITPIQQEVHQIKEVDYSDPQIKAYFQLKAVLNDHNKTMAIDLAHQKMMVMKQYIKEGFITLPQNRKNIGDIINRSSPMAKEGEKLNKYLHQKSELEIQLKKMEDAIRNANAETKNNASSPRRREPEAISPISPQEHKKFMDRISKIKKQNEEKRKMHVEYQQNRLKELQKKQEESEHSLKQQQLLEKRNHLKQRIQTIIKRRQKVKQEQLESSKRFKSVCQQKRRHEMMQEQYHNSILLPMIEQKNKILEERSKHLQSIKVEDIKEYEKQYMKSRQQRQEQSRNEESNWHYKPPAYSSKMLKILEEQKILQKVRMQEEKRRLEQLKTRQESYKQYLKQRFSSVRIDEKKRLQISTIINKEKSVRDELSEASIRDIGNKYLLEVRSKVKSIEKDKKESLSTNQETNKKSKIRDTFKIKSNTSMGSYGTQPSSAELNNKKIDKIVSSISTKHEKLQKLKIQVQKLSEKSERKQQLIKHTKKQKQDDEDIDNLLSSIKAKVSIIELYKD